VVRFNFSILVKLYHKQAIAGIGGCGVVASMVLGLEQCFKNRIEDRIGEITDLRFNWFNRLNRN
jgi:hypothetical protein